MTLTKTEQDHRWRIISIEGATESLDMYNQRIKRMILSIKKGGSQMNKEQISDIKETMSQLQGSLNEITAMLDTMQHRE